ncbi:hypothetical protein, partial [Burkholderia cenocepacia]
AAPTVQHCRPESLPRIEHQRPASERALDVKELPLDVVDDVMRVPCTEHDAARRAVEQVDVVALDRKEHELADDDLASQHRQAVVDIPSMPNGWRQAGKLVGLERA